MSTNAEMTEIMMDDIGKSSLQVRKRVTAAVGETTVDLLSQNDGRFRRLAKFTTITLNTTDTVYKLPSDFHTVKNIVEQNADGDFLRKIEIVSDTEFHGRAGNTDYGGQYYCYIEYRRTGASGPGEYLILSEVRTATAYYKFSYYRVPTANDTDIIPNDSVLKEGVRSKLGNLAADARNSLLVYTQNKPNIIESVEHVTTGLVIKPSKKSQARNRQMRKIGQGG